MDQVIQDSSKIIATLGNLFKRDNLMPEYEILSNSQSIIENTDFDNWNGGTDVYSIFCKAPLDIYSKYEYEIESIELSIKSKAEKIFRTYPQCWINEVIISPELSNEIQGKLYKTGNDELLKLLEIQKSIMVSVSTGGARIQNVNSEYQERAATISEGLAERGIKNKISFDDLWEWHGKWSDGSLPTWKDRRVYIADMFKPLFEAVKNTGQKATNPIFEEPTGWVRVDRTVGEIKLRLVQASTEEQYQAIGLLCREALISLAQVVFIEEEHETLDGIAASKTDAKRMLDAYIAHQVDGKSNANIRKHARASLDLANDLTHRRTAEYRISAVCAEATNAVVNIIAIISGRRDRK
jgi:hypothetical protein